METEFQLLNAKLSEKADNLELAEEQIWNLYAEYQGTTWQGEVEYPGSFNIRDTGREVQQLVTAKTAATDPVLLRVIDEHLMELLDGDVTRLPVVPGVAVSVATDSQGEHPSLANSSEEDRLAHIQTMLMEGYSNDEIMALHPEVTEDMIVAAGAAAAASN
jgi:hypothetical protein